VKLLDDAVRESNVLMAAVDRIENVTVAGNLCLGSIARLTFCSNDFLHPAALCDHTFDSIATLYALDDGTLP